MALMLERQPDERGVVSVYRGRSRDLIITLKVWPDEGHPEGAHVGARTSEGEPAYEHTWPTRDAALEYLCEVEEVEAVVIYDPGTGKSHVHTGRLRPPVPPEPLDGGVVLPAFPGASRAILAPPEGHWHVEPGQVSKVERMRIGQDVGSMLYVTNRDGEVVGMPVGVEPGAVLMRIYHVSPEDAYRLGAERDPTEQPT